MGLAPQLGRETAPPRGEARVRCCPAKGSGLSEALAHESAVAEKLSRAAIDRLTDPACYLGSTQASSTASSPMNAAVAGCDRAAAYGGGQDARALHHLRRDHRLRAAQEGQPGGARSRSSEQVESTHEAYEAGAALVHVHVRDEQENSSSDVWRFEKLQEGIRKHCPDIIIQFSTGGRGRSMEQRGAMLHLKPDMASLATGSVNFPTIVYENPPDFIRHLAKTMLENDVKPEIEVFDLAMVYNTANW